MTEREQAMIEAIKQRIAIYRAKQEKAGYGGRFETTRAEWESIKAEACDMVLYDVLTAIGEPSVIAEWME